ncbi:MAG TPA: AmmeMemoRadiSam system protein B, partial [Candidatus Krumholzibacteria bacterium]|nr:AmmeMemoRadiSam system protein B [Candidatus Krumholzibacteria bacterium]
LDKALLLDNDRFRAAHAAHVAAYRAAPARDNRQRWPDGDALRAEITAMLADGAAAPDGDVAGVIAPHLDYARGAPCYADAYAILDEAPPAERYVILGTNHAGLGRGVVATGKDFLTPLGRVPTDRGYRLYVDGLTAGWGLRRLEAPRAMTALVERGLGGGAAAGIKDLAGLLSRLTDALGIIVGPTWETVRIVRVEIYPRTPRRALLVVVLDNAQVRTGQVTFGQDRTVAVLGDATALLNRRAAGRSVAEVRSGALEPPDLLGSPASRCAVDLATETRRLLVDLAEGEVELEGVANVLEEPEFQEPGPLQALLRFIESPRSIRQALDRLDRQAGDGFGVWIGDENPVGGLRSFSVLTRRFAVDGRRGVLAVLGPRRMGYQRAFHGMDLLGAAIDADPGRVAS